uniref:Uncharacterized protein n=1 Tax=Ditylenchus dipsaci TaxID=166011 RepID=A0A915CSG3_9BILA
MALYFGLVHQRGPHAAANFVFSRILEPNPNTTVHILQLMPCFSMPQHSSLHPHTVHIRMLDCTASLESMNSRSPELVNGQVEEYREEGYDEADQFHNDPLGWIRDNWPLIKPSTEGISVVIAYEKTYRRIESFWRRKTIKL